MLQVLFFLIGYLRFYIPIIKEEDIILLNIIVEFYLLVYVFII